MATSSVVIDKIMCVLNAMKADKLLDVGCGGGTLSKLLSEAGYDVTGIDPLQKALIKAAQVAPGAQFVCAGADDIPLPDKSFDAIILLNVFHHIPPDAMNSSMDEFARLLRKSGELIIAEPLARGSFFKAMRPVEDETDIRSHALQVLQQVSEQGKWQIKSKHELDRISHFTNVDQFTDALIAVDPDREQAAQFNRDELNRQFHAHSMKEGDQFVLVQPHILWRMAPR